MDVDQAIRALEKKFKGLKVMNFEHDNDSDDPKGRCSMSLHINGKISLYEGHLLDFQKMNKLFVEKVEKLVTQQQ